MPTTRALLVAGTILLLLAVLECASFAQTPTPVKAGDPAPNLTWTKVVSSDASSPGPQSLSGHVTVLQFLPPVSVNEEQLSSWNSLVEHFADKPVNFVWIATEKEEPLAPFLKAHPARGWMVLDPQRTSYKAYGIDGGSGVLINSKGAIAGFTTMTPSQAEVQAVLDGNAMSIDGEPTDAQLDALFEDRAVRLETKPFRIDRDPAEKPTFPPSDDVHISRSPAKGAESSSGPDYWVRRGFDLKTILSEISGTRPNRIELPTTLDQDARYDFVLVPPREEDQDTINKQVLDAIEKYLRVAVTHEARSVDVYLMTAIKGKTPRRKSESEAMGGSVSAVSARFEITSDAVDLPEGKPSRKAVEEESRRIMNSPEFRQGMAAAQLTAASAFSSSVDEFCSALEDGFHRPVINQTGLDGYYDFKTQGEAHTTDEFIKMLRDQVGLVLTPAQQVLDITVVRPLQ